MPGVMHHAVNPTGQWRTFCALLACLSLYLALVPSANAHQLRLAYLQLNEIAPETYDVLWKVPALGDSLRMALTAQLPAHCIAKTEPRGSIDGAAHTARWRIVCPGGLSGGHIQIIGLAEATADALVRIGFLDGSNQVARLAADVPEFAVTPTPDGVQVAATYLGLGIEHILLGIDHLLFVLALLLITNGVWKLVKTVTAFTLAHSITLTLAALGFVHVPSAPVEAVIALSIVFVATEILRTQQGREGITARAPWLVAFSFGLLHGFGFAGALSEIGLPQGHIPLALLFFNAGVELGQLLFIATVLGFIILVRRLRFPVWAVRVPPYAIGTVAMFWVIERVTVF